MSWSFYDPSMSASQHRPRMKGFVLYMDQIVAYLERGFSTCQVADTCS